MAGGTKAGGTAVVSVTQLVKVVAITKECSRIVISSVMVIEIVEHM